jgi:hypothetical protein
MTEMIVSIQTSVMRRGITRLCHFTPSHNLGHIAEDRVGILASKHLREDEKAVFNPTDSERLDGYLDYVCCSIQYPNAWYFKKARDRESLFRDWVILLLKPYYLWYAGAKFCPRNAAVEHGRLVDEGAEAFEELFADTVEGTHTYRRDHRHPAFLPTDEQAEVLIPDHIRRGDVIGIAVYDDEQAQREVARLKLLGQSLSPILIVPEFFDPNKLSQLLRAGRVPTEREHQQGDPHAR